MPEWLTSDLLQGMAAIIAALAGPVAAIGLGIKWVLKRMDRRADLIEERQNSLHREFRRVLEERIVDQAHRILVLERTLDRYMHHVGVLETMMRAQDMDVPPMRKFP